MRFGSRQRVRVRGPVSPAPPGRRPGRRRDPARSSLQRERRRGAVRRRPQTAARARRREARALRVGADGSLDDVDLGTGRGRRADEDGVLPPVFGADAGRGHDCSAGARRGPEGGRARITGRQDRRVRPGDDDPAARRLAAHRLRGRGLRPEQGADRRLPAPVLQPGRGPSWKRCRRPAPSASSWCSTSPP